MKRLDRFSKFEIIRKMTYLVDGTLELHLKLLQFNRYAGTEEWFVGDKICREPFRFLKKSLNFCHTCISI